MKALLRRLVSLMPTALANRVHSYKHKRNWNGRMAQEHHKYFNQYETRAFLVDLLPANLKAADELSIFEMGCSGGNNLRLFQERLNCRLRYTGIDISTEAVQFARSNFPDSVFEVGGSHQACQLLEGSEHDVFLASGVLSYLPETECGAILNAASRSCRHLILCDFLDRLDEMHGIESGVFHHPFRRLLEDAGWHISGNDISAPRNDVYSSLVAISGKTS